MNKKKNIKPNQTTIDHNKYFIQWIDLFQIHFCLNVYNHLRLFEGLSERAFILALDSLIFVTP